MVVLHIFFNLSLIVSICVISGLIDRRLHRSTINGKVIQGIIFGATAIAGMIYPFELTKGLIFDGRTIAISSCTLFFGPLSGVIASMTAAAYRIYIGGPGVIMGVSTIIAALVVGYIFYRIKLNKPSGWMSAGRLYLFGLSVHIAMMALIVTLPGRYIMDAIGQLSFAILGVYPIFTVLLCKILSDHEAIDQYIREIEASEQLFKNLFEHHSAVKLLIDPETGRIIDANRSAVLFYGWDREQLKKMKIEDINTLSPEEVKEEMTNAKINKKSFFEFKHRLSDGSVRDVAVFSSFISVKGEGILHSIIHDITDRRQVEEEHRRLQAQLYHAQKMESLGYLAGGIAHDFNNLLTSVIGFAHIIKLKVEKDNPLIEYADQIILAGQRGAALTRQILAFSRKQRLDIKSVGINGIIKNLEKMLYRLLREDINITFRLSEDDITVFADASQIEQVIINLITNARDSMQRGGSIDIKTESFVMDRGFKEQHGYGSPGEYALITISDTGSGMSDKTLSHIFEPFFTTKEVGKGTGLGLSVVYGIIKQHKGYINVQSEVDKGTVFWIYLPKSEVADNTGKASEHLVHIIGGNETILVAEDDPSLIRLCSTILSEYGYSVIEAANGQEAVSKFADNRDIIKLVLLDGIMPVKNGREALEEIRAMRPDIKAVFMSGYAEDIVSSEVVIDKSERFIEKPITPETLLHVVKDVLEKA